MEGYDDGAARDHVANSSCCGASGWAALEAAQSASRLHVQASADCVLFFLLCATTVAACALGPGGLYVCYRTVQCN